MPDFSELAKIRHETMLRLFPDQKPAGMPDLFEDLPNDVKEHLTRIEHEFMTACINKGVLQFVTKE